MKKEFTIIDLFAGIGGTRLAFEKESFKIVWSNEIDDFCCKTYEANFGENPKGDITKVDIKNIPDFDVLVAGFPCQAFSIAGAKLGFEDTRGTLFFEIARILKEKRPKAFLLENVANLKRHDNGKTFQRIIRVLEKELDYRVFYNILKAQDFGLPQKRQRILIAGFGKGILYKGFSFPLGNGKPTKLKDILEKNVPLKYYLSERRLLGMERHKERHKSKGHGFGYQILDPNGLANTIVVGGMGRERNIIADEGSIKPFLGTDETKDKNKKYLRYLTPREYARLQGFPENFKIPVSNAQAYKQFANSVPIPIISALAKRIKWVLEKNYRTV